MSYHQDFNPGDHVTWNSPQGVVHGTILRKATCKVVIRDVELSASRTDPAYVVKSDKTGALAAHRSKALRRAGGVH